MYEARLGGPAFRAGRGIEQPIIELALHRLGPGGIDVEGFPQLLDGLPVARQPSAALVGPIAFRLPLRTAAGPCADAGAVTIRCFAAAVARS